MPTPHPQLTIISHHISKHFHWLIAFCSYQQWNVCVLFRVFLYSIFFSFFSLHSKNWLRYESLISWRRGLMVNGNLINGDEWAGDFDKRKSSQNLRKFLTDSYISIDIRRSEQKRWKWKLEKREKRTEIVCWSVEWIPPGIRHTSDIR